jgi:hypothetical protein
MYLCMHLFPTCLYSLPEHVCRTASSLNFHMSVTFQIHTLGLLECGGSVDHNLTTIIDLSQFHRFTLRQSYHILHPDRVHFVRCALKSTTSTNVDARLRASSNNATDSMINNQICSATSHAATRLTREAIVQSIYQRKRRPLLSIVDVLLDRQDCTAIAILICRK